MILNMEWNKSIQEFSMHLKLEKSMSRNSVEAYLHDIGSFFQFIQVQHIGVEPEMVNLEYIREFVKWLNGFGVSARTQSRMLSGIRAFYKFLLIEDRITTNPTGTGNR